MHFVSFAFYLYISLQKIFCIPNNVSKKRKIGISLKLLSMIDFCNIIFNMNLGKSEIKS